MSQWVVATDGIPEADASMSETGAPPSISPLEDSPRPVRACVQSRELHAPLRLPERGLALVERKLVKIGAKIVYHLKMTVFQMAEVAVPEKLFRSMLFRSMLSLIHRLGRACARAPALSL